MVLIFDGLVDWEEYRNLRNNYGLDIVTTLERYNLFKDHNEIAKSINRDIDRFDGQMFVELMFYEFTIGIGGYHEIRGRGNTPGWPNYKNKVQVGVGNIFGVEGASGHFSDPGYLTPRAENYGIWNNQFMYDGPRSEFLTERLPLHTRILQVEKGVVLWNCVLPEAYRLELSEYSELRRGIDIPFGFEDQGDGSSKARAVIIGNKEVSRFFGVDADSVTDQDSLYQALLEKEGIYRDFPGLSFPLRGENKVSDEDPELGRRMVQRFSDLKLYLESRVDDFFREGIFSYGIEKPSGYGIDTGVQMERILMARNY